MAHKRATALAVAWLGAASFASLTGSLIYLIGLAAYHSASLGDFAMIPPAMALMSFFAFFIILLGLLVLGIPAALVLPDKASALWMVPFSIAVGAVAGTLTALIVLNGYEVAGAICGASSGFFWHRFASRALTITEID